MHPNISLPTRITPNSKTLIDNFISNDICSLDLPNVIFSDISDNLPIEIGLKFEPFSPDTLKHNATVKRVWSETGGVKWDRN